jgi:hypothetical protein
MRTPVVPPTDLDAMLKRPHLPTVRRLYGELARRAEGESMTYQTFLELLIAEEIAHRAETRLRRAVRKAQFPFLRTIPARRIWPPPSRTARCSMATKPASCPPTC